MTWMFEKGKNLFKMCFHGSDKGQIGILKNTCKEIKKQLMVMDFKHLNNKSFQGSTIMF